MSKIDVLGMIEELRQETLAKYPEGHDFGELAIIQIDDDPASNLYIKSKNKELAKWGIKTTVIHFHTDQFRSIYSEEKYLTNILYAIHDTITIFNNKDYCKGIILQLPLPDYLKPYEQSLIDNISPDKNVDGFKQNYKSAHFFTPCTPKGIMYILKELRNIKGKTICLIGRGKTVGKPLINMLSNEPCTLICCNSHTNKEKLEKIFSISDIIISAVGKPGLIKTGYLNDGTLVIDAGISYVDGKQTGDYSHSNEFDDYIDIDYTPHLGGVGKMTVAMLAMNCIKAWELQGK